MAARKEAAAQPGGEFILQRLARYEDEDILADLRRVAALVDHRHLLIRDYARLGHCNYTTVLARLGSWQAALERAGLGHRWSAQSPLTRLRRNHPLSRDYVLAALRRIARRRGDGIATRQDLRGEGFGRKTIFRLFGTWDAALEAAGVKASRHGRSYSDEEVWESLRRVWLHCGRQPTVADLTRPPSTVSAFAYRARFGSWTKALRYFAQVESDRAAGRATVPMKLRLVPRGARADKPRAPAKGRQVPPAMRFQVLQRDRFKCTACGASPATDAATTLQIDHVVPYSKGGRTEPGNLATLCARCNVGKGDILQGHNTLVGTLLSASAVNYGKGPAFVSTIEWDIRPEREIPPLGKKLSYRNTAFVGWTLPPGREQELKHAVCSLLPQAETYVFYGRVSYQDIFRQRLWDSEFMHRIYADGTSAPVEGRDAYARTTKET